MLAQTLTREAEARENQHVITSSPLASYAGVCVRPHAERPPDLLSVEGLARHPQFPAEIGDLRFGLTHRP